MQNYNADLSVFHLYNNCHIKLIEFINIINQLTNQNINILSKEDFDTTINSILNNSGNELKGIINDFDKKRNLSYSSNMKISSENTQFFLSKLKFYWPKIDSEYIVKYIKYLHKNHII